MDGVGLIEETRPLSNPFADLRVDLTVVMESPEKAGPLLEFLDSIGDSVDSYQKSSGESGTAVVKIYGLMAGYMENIDAMDGVESMTGRESGSRSIVPSSSSLAVPRRIGADQWHCAGFTGSDLKVAVFDGNLKGVDTLVAPLLCGCVASSPMCGSDFSPVNRVGLAACCFRMARPGALQFSSRLLGSSGLDGHHGVRCAPDPT